MGFKICYLHGTFLERVEIMVTSSFIKSPHPSTSLQFHKQISTLFHPFFPLSKNMAKSLYFLYPNKFLHIFFCLALLLLVHASHARLIERRVFEMKGDKADLKPSEFTIDGSSGGSRKALENTQGIIYTSRNRKALETKYGTLVLNFLPKGSKAPSSPSRKHNDFNT